MQKITAATLEFDSLLYPFVVDKMRPSLLKNWGKPWNCEVLSLVWLSDGNINNKTRRTKDVSSFANWWPTIINGCLEWPLFDEDLDNKSPTKVLLHFFDIPTLVTLTGKCSYNCLCYNFFLLLLSLLAFLVAQVFGSQFVTFWYRH